jgi:predicted AAA+ superfamily ATPase
MTGLTRNQEHTINQMLTLFPVVLIIGARQVGKTTLARKCRPEWRYFDLERSSDFDFITADYDFFFREYASHVIIDEAQESPQLFRELRSAIDADRKCKNRFILTGSSSPELLSGVADSLAGRIGIIELGVCKRNELLRESLSDFYQIFSEPIQSNTLKTLRELTSTTDDVLPNVLSGGYPEPAMRNDAEALSIWMDNYFKTYIASDVRRLFPRLDALKYRRFISMLASLSGTMINKAQLGRSIDVSEVTIRDYLDIAHQTLIWRNIPAYHDVSGHALVKMPKGVLRDSGLLTFLNHIANREQLIRSPLVGQIFESYVIEEILKGMHASNIASWDYFYYRTRNGAEIDLILKGNFGLLPIEIKFGLSTRLKQITALSKFAQEHQTIGIVINQSNEVRMLSDSVIQIPVSVL